MTNRYIFYMCDDCAEFIELIEDRIRSKFQEDYLCDVISFENGNDLLKKYSEEIPDAVFLDIDMPEMSGFEVATAIRKINRDAIIVFITNYDDLLVQSYKHNAFYFIRKSYLDDFDRILPHVIAKIQVQRERKNGVFTFLADGKEYEFDVNQIKYIQSHRHYIMLKNSDDTLYGPIRCKISDAEMQLEKMQFVRIQNSVIVNCRFIKKVSSRDVTLTCGEKIHISRDKVQYVKEAFIDYSSGR